MFWNGIHAFDFPENTFFEVEDSFRRFLMNKAISLCGSQRKLAKELSEICKRKIPQFMIWKWRAGRKNKPNRFPLFGIKAICELFKKKNVNEPNIFEIEKHITAFTLKRSNLIIKNCSFPILIDERIVRVVFHIMAEGCVSTAPSNFFNTCEALKEEFKNDLKILGNIPVTIREKNKIEFPKQIGVILKHIFQIDFHSSKIEIPKIFWKLNRKVLANGIRVIVDDEGSINDSCIRIVSISRKFLLQLMLLIMKKFPKLSIHMSGVRRGTKTKNGICFNLTIKSTGLKVFKKLIGTPLHPEKAKELEFLIKIQNRTWCKRAKSETKKIILEALKEGPKTCKELEKICFITRSMVLKHIKGAKKLPSLEKMGLVRLSGFKKRSFLWSITKKGISSLK